MRFIILTVIMLAYFNCYSQNFDFELYDSLKVTSIDTVTDYGNNYIITVVDSEDNEFLILSKYTSNDSIAHGYNKIRIGNTYSLHLKKMQFYTTKYGHNVSLVQWNGFIIGNGFDGLNIAKDGKLPYEAKELIGLYLPE